jgi:PAT family beta-lactamase induction signal transducer AmpG
MSSATAVKTGESALDSGKLSFLPHEETHGPALAVTGRHLLMFGSLYFAQGAMVAYFSNFQKPYLSSAGINANTIGVLSGLILLPFILKIGMGLISDRVNLLGFGYRKPYILLGLTLAIAMLAVASVVKPQLNLTLFASLVFLASVGMALFDTATDGLAVDISNPKWHGAVQASMVAGRAVGLIVISWSCGLLAERQNYFDSARDCALSFGPTFPHRAISRAARTR